MKINDTNANLTYGELYQKEKRQVIIAYIDVSGYKDALKKRGETELFACIHKAVTAMGRLLRLSGPTKEIKTSFLTDSGIVYFDDKNDDESNALLNALLCALGLFQFILMTECNLMIRGGISTGPLYDKDFIFGDGYLNALDMEERVADYQRIVIDSKLIGRVTEPVKSSLLYSCIDGNYMVNYLEAAIKAKSYIDFDKSEIIKKHESALSFIGTEALKPRIDSIVDQIFEGQSPTADELCSFEKINGRYSRIVDYHLHMCRKYNCDTKVTNPESQSQLYCCWVDLIKQIKAYNGDDEQIDASIKLFKNEYKKMISVSRGQ